MRKISVGAAFSSVSATALLSATLLSQVAEVVDPPRVDMMLAMLDFGWNASGRRPKESPVLLLLLDARERLVVWFE